MNSQPWYITTKINPKDNTAIIIGGGLAGTSAAYSLAVRGWNVKIIERNKQLALEASGNPVGILTPLITHKNDPIGEFYLRGFEYSLSHFKELSASNNKDIFRATGAVDLTANKITRNLSDTIIPNEYINKISKDEATDICGVKISSGALYMQDCGFVDPAALCIANIEAFDKNIEVIFSKEILSLVKEGDDWSVLDNCGVNIASAAVVIIANAADAVNFVQSGWIPLHKVRGQLTYLPASNLNLKKILCYDGGYITPEINGFHYVGATYSRDNLNYDISLEDHAANLKNLRNVIDVGDVDHASLQGRVAFRASVIDRRPVIGAIPDYSAFLEDYADLHHGRKHKSYPAGKYHSGLYISTGYGSRGLAGCPIGGELIAAMVNNEGLPLPQDIVNTLNPARFIIKKLKAGKYKATS